MRRVVVLAAALAGVVAGSAPAEDAQPPLAVVDGKVTRLDASLTPVGPRLDLGAFGPWSYSPDRSRLAVASEYAPRVGTQVRLRVADVASMRQIASIRLGRDPQLRTGYVSPVVLVAWLTRDRVVVLRRLRDSSSQLLVVDVAARAVVSRRAFRGFVLARRVVAPELVLLVGTEEKISVPRLVVVDARGSERSVALRPLRAGVVWNTDVDPPRGQEWLPGLAVDAARRLAYVAAPSRVVAEVPLATMDPTYHGLGGTVAKVLTGSVREATLVGEGLLAVSGTEFDAARDAAGETYTTSTPARVELVDTRTWTARTLGSGSGVVRWRDGFVVAGSSYDSRSDVASGTGLVVHAADGAVRYRMLEGEATGVSAIVGDRAYVWVGAGRGIAVVDLAAGRVVERRSSTFPLLLVERDW